MCVTLVAWSSPTQVKGDQQSNINLCEETKKFVMWTKMYFLQQENALSFGRTFGDPGKTWREPGEIFSISWGVFRGTFKNTDLPCRNKLR